MYAYCSNNPINYVDPSGHKAVYGNVVSKNGKKYSVKTTITITKKNKQTKYVYRYNISKKGIVQFEFKNNSYKKILKNEGRYTLAKAMRSAARSTNSNYLSGRTIDGIDMELQLHYIAYKNGIKVSSSKCADIGGTNKKKVGYDSNAWFFEWLVNSDTNYKNTDWKSRL